MVIGFRVHVSIFSVDSLSRSYVVIQRRVTTPPSDLHADTVELVIPDVSRLLSKWDRLTANVTFFDFRHKWISRTRRQRYNSLNLKYYMTSTFLIPWMLSLTKVEF